MVLRVLYESMKQLFIWFSKIVASMIRVCLLSSTIHSKKFVFQVPIYGNHRDTARELYENAFTSGDEVFILSIMSKNSLRVIEPRLARARSHQTCVKVLT